MGKAKLAITIDEKLLRSIDRRVGRDGEYRNRSVLIQEAVREKLARLDRVRLARECAKLDQQEEQRLAEEGLSTDRAEWPEY